MNTETIPARNGSVLSCRNVSKAYRQGSQVVTVLSGLGCEIGAGELVAIVGSSGSGKSTLLNLMGGLDDPDSGEIHVQGQLMKPLSESRRARWRNAHLGFVYQFHHLLGEFSALENVAIPNLIAGMSRAEAESKARVLLERVGLGERTSHKPAALSGGERQRVAVCRALINNPRLLLADEPTGNLDRINTEAIGKLLLDINQEQNTILICVTHSRELAILFPQHQRLRDGSLVTETA